MLNDWGTRLTVTNSLFSGNRADDFGGAIQCQWDSGLQVESSVFIGNQARNGGAITAHGEVWTEVVNSTFASNIAHDSGGAFAGDQQADLTVANSIVWGNRPSATGNQVTIHVTYSDFQGGIAGEGNINGDPLFTNIENGDVSLQAGSPCIDAANGDKAPSHDKTGFPRSDDPSTENTGAGEPTFADMGALEFNTCGNGTLEENEACEGEALGDNTDCQDLGYVASGSLSCTEFCTYDLSNCVAECGNGMIEPSETCEGANLDGNTCEALGCQHMFIIRDDQNLVVGLDGHTVLDDHSGSFGERYGRFHAVLLFRQCLPLLRFCVSAVSRIVDPPASI